MKYSFQKLCVACIATLLSFAAAGQDDEKTPESADKAAPADEAAGSKAKDKDGAVPAAPSGGTILPKPKGGDKIYFKSGSVMSGVQVVKSTPANYEVQLIAGEAPMLIPRREVEKVEYDDIDPLRDEMRKRMFPEPEEVTMASGERVTSELHDKLKAPISAEPLTYQEMDLVAVLNEIKTKTQVKLTVDPSIEEKPAGQRKWSLEIAAGRTLMELLREDLVNRFAYAEVIFENDTILVMTKDAAKKRAEAAGATAPGGPAPVAETPPVTDAPVALPPLKKPKNPGT